MPVINLLAAFLMPPVTLLRKVEEMHYDCRAMRVRYNSTYDELLLVRVPCNSSSFLWVE